MEAPRSLDVSRTSGMSRTAVLDILRAAGKPLSVQEIAEQVGLHTNTVRFHLTRLMQDGTVVEEQHGPTGGHGPGRPRTAYRAAPRSAAQPTTDYQLLADILAGLAATAPDPIATATAAGEKWGHYLADRPMPFSRVTSTQAVDQLMDLLERLHFMPELDQQEHQVLLRSCPYRAVADHVPDVVCSIHLGLMRGSLVEMDAPVEVTKLTRSPAPLPCVARLATREH